jgi:hypothetical protein
MKRLFQALSIILAAFFVLTAESCDGQPNATQKEAATQERIQSESQAQVGMPAIVNFAEKRNYKMIYELRDNPNYSTYTYLIGMSNNHTPLCHSVGYGIPESSEYTNPQMIGYQAERTGVVTLPQADPNGLFSSPSSNGTWVMCMFKDNKVLPVRSEPSVLTLPEPWSQLEQDGM